MFNQYLQRHAEPEARLLSATPFPCHYQHCLIIPAYKEPPELIARLQTTAQQQPGLLVILVLNHPQDGADPNPNWALRKASAALPACSAVACGKLYLLVGDSHLLVVEREAGLPNKQGVGLARKLGCDLALALIASGNIASLWLNSSDADATLPLDYFSSTSAARDCVAIAHPFRHSLPADPATARAVALYELRLHYYVLGLRWAGSPYAFHTLGSCLSVTAASYAAVRGFPRRNAAEDFYLLNKLAKLGPVLTPTAPVIELDGRVSNRVPFGTGPAIAKLAAAGSPLSSPLFYNPQSFVALQTLLTGLPALYSGGDVAALYPRGAHAAAILEEMGIAEALQHCRQQSRDLAAWLRHFMQWFDGFRTLKFLHALRAAGYEDLDLAASRAHPNSIWPADWSFTRIESLPLEQQSANIGQ